MAESENSSVTKKSRPKIPLFFRFENFSNKTRLLYKTTYIVKNQTDLHYFELLRIDKFNKNLF